MKKLALLVIAFALIIGMTQCKKKAATPVSDNSIQITLSANNGGDDKTVFDGTGFTWSGTEIIYVGGNSTGYLGYLTSTLIYDEGKKANFSGNIDNPSGNDILYFFYLGKGGVKAETGRNTINFSKQDGSIENVTKYHIAIGSAAYSSTNTYTDVTFDMKMAIARFNTSGFDGSVYIHGDGVYSAATVDYQTGTITGTTKGYNLIGTANADCYVAMIPQPTPAETNVKFESGAHSGELTFLRGIKEGRYYCGNNSSLAVTAATITDTKGGLFSINGTDRIPTKMVRFSKGNLQYQADNGNGSSTWRFAENQWDYVGDATNGNVYVSEVKSNNASISSDYTGWIDLFGWGTSGIDGYTPIATCYQPYSTSTDNSQYNPYGSTSTNLYDGGDNAGKADWGYAANGGYSTWRTLTEDELVYVFETRTTTSGVRYAKATVNGVSGVILLPDNWSTSYYTLTSTNTSSAEYTSNKITLSDWDTSLEANGAVFLPAAGNRVGTSVTNAGSRGYYWSSTSYESDTNRAYYVYFFSGNVRPQNFRNRSYGLSVRLARVVE